VIVEINGKYCFTVDVCLPERKQREKITHCWALFLTQRKEKREGKNVYCSSFL
jgi:hypothetical protein